MDPAEVSTAPTSESDWFSFETRRCFCVLVGRSLAVPCLSPPYQRSSTPVHAPVPQVL